jgi:hypothetical protein
LTAPNQPTPNGSQVPGTFAALQNATAEDTQAALTQGVRVSYGSAQNTHTTNVVERIDGNYALALEAQGSADSAVTTAQAAANAAANAEDLADKAYENASFWIIECVVASAGVVLGVNELLLGPVLNVPDDQEAILTDIHIALLSQPNGMTVETRKWNATGTAWTTVTSTVMGANETRRNVPLLAEPVLDKERFYYSVTSVTGSIAPQVLQIAVAGVFIPAGG